MLNSVITPEIVEIDGIQYYIFNGEVHVVSVFDYVTEAVIPETIEGYPVTDIIDAFRNSSVEKVVLPKTVTKIQEYAFEGCKNLKTVEMSDGVTNIGYSAFMNCEKLEEINIPNGLTEIKTQVFSPVQDKCCENLRGILCVFVPLNGDIF